MHILGYLFLTLSRVLGFLINLYTFIVTAAVILSWVRPDPTNPLVRFLNQTTEPVFRQVRRLLPARWAYGTGFDFSPIIVFILLIVLDTFCVGLLRELAQTLLRK